MHYSILVGIASAFETVGHVQESVRRVAKCTLKEFQKVSVVSNTSLSTRIWSFRETAILCFAIHWSLILIDLAADFSG